MHLEEVLAEVGVVDRLAPGRRARAAARAPRGRALKRSSRGVAGVEVVDAHRARRRGGGRRRRPGSAENGERERHEDERGAVQRRAVGHVGGLLGRSGRIVLRIRPPAFAANPRRRRRRTVPLEPSLIHGRALTLRRPPPSPPPAARSALPSLGVTRQLRRSPACTRSAASRSVERGAGDGAEQLASRPPLVAIPHQVVVGVLADQRREHLAGDHLAGHRRGRQAEPDLVGRPIDDLPGASPRRGRARRSPACRRARAGSARRRWSARSSSTEKRVITTGSGPRSS